jgi:hypothetical protein
MKRVTRNLKTRETREFWAHAKKVAEEVSTWPDWKKVGVAPAKEKETTVSMSLMDEALKNIDSISDGEFSKITQEIIRESSIKR